MPKHLSIKKKNILKKNLNVLKVGSALDHRSRKIFMNKAPRKFQNILKILSEIILDGTLKLGDDILKILRKYRNPIRSIAHGKDIKGLTQKVGSISGFFKTVIPTILPILISLL